MWAKSMQDYCAIKPKTRGGKQDLATCADFCLFVLCANSPFLFAKTITCCYALCHLSSTNQLNIPLDLRAKSSPV
jgi:hypothetical protein